MDLDTQQMLSLALDDELRARATYQSVIDAYGPVAPFTNIVQAEQRHIDALLPLFARYAVPLLRDRWSGQVNSPPSLSGACAAGVAAEINNYRMYDAFLTRTVDPDLRAVFMQLRNASAFAHLPAFQACLASSTASPQTDPHPVRSVPPALAQIPTPVHSRASLAIGVALGVGIAWWLAHRSREA